jgi:GPH family glycoside/pentoside/hexuronide:cation symporter
LNPLSNRQKIGYGVGDIAICFYWSGVGLYLLYFYTDIVGISPYLAGWIYALGIAWDAVTDPFMGYLAERTSSKRGRYRPYIFFWDDSIRSIFRFIVLGASFYRTIPIFMFITY